MDRGLCGVSVRCRSDGAGVRFLLAALFLLALDSPDVQRWRSCSTRSGVRQGNDGCKPLDLDGDGDVDQSDFGLWQRQQAPAPSSCPPCEPCPCDPNAEHGAQITCQVWRPLPADMQAEWDAWQQDFGKRLATRPAN